MRAFKSWAGERPSDARGETPKLDIEYATWRRLCRGRLDVEESREFLEQFLRIYPAAMPARPGDSGGEAPRVVIDGGFYERVCAEKLWHEIRDLDPAAQRRRVRQHLFHSSALFDLLRRRSREEGRRDRGRGVAIAELALVSLEGSEGVFGESLCGAS
ncbi:MAG: hypothetical protein GY719_16040 [bacterium]|nr:hypothetical protein [bacterium]